MRNVTKKATMQIGFKMLREEKKKERKFQAISYMKDCNENYRKSLEGMEKKTMKFLNARCSDTIFWKKSIRLFLYLLKMQCKWYLRIVNEQITNNRCARPVRLKKGGGGCKREQNGGRDDGTRL